MSSPTGLPPAPAPPGSEPPPSAPPAPPAPRAEPVAASSRRRPARRRARQLVPLAAGLAVALGSTALSGVLRGDRWLWYVLATVAVVVALGQLVRALRVPVAAVPVAQLIGLVLLLTGLFSTTATYRVLPGPAALAELGHALAVALTQIEGGVPPVPTTLALALLVSVGYGVVAIAVDAFAAAGHGPATCGLALLGAYTVPTALAPHALPDWSLAAGTAGFVLVLATEHRARQSARGIRTARPVPPGAGPPGRLGRAFARVRGIGHGALAMLLAVAALGASLGVGLLAAPLIGTHGRFAGHGHGDSGASDGQFGVNPFTSLRGQLENDTPVELLRVSGLPAPSYLRSLTLTRYVPQRGWQLPDRYNGVTLDHSLPSGMATPVNNPTALITVRNVGYLDQWLPLYGQPMGVTGTVPGRWHYDVQTGTAYTDTPVREATWTERAALPNPSVSALEQSPPVTDVNPTFLDTSGVDPRISALAQAVTRRAHTPFDRAVALNRYFLDPAFGFHYDLRTRPGNSGDALVDFLTRGKTGYCEQFASAMAIMLRTVGVPARVAIGFSAGKQVGDYRSISTGDAHAWVEAYFSGIGWLPFDPTPLNDGRSVRPSYLDDAPNVGIQVPPSVANGQPGPDGRQQAEQPPGGPSDRPTPDNGEGDRADQEQDGDQRDAPPPSSGPAPTPPPSAGRPGADGPTGDAPDAAGNGDDRAGGAGTADGGATPGGPGGDGPSGAGGDRNGTGAGGFSPGGEQDQVQVALGGARIALRVLLLTALALLALVTLMFTPALVRGLARRRRLTRAARGGADGAVAAWREVLAEFRDRGSEPAGNDTVRSTARQFAGAYRLDAETCVGLKTIVGAVERGWYAPERDPGPGAALVSAVTTVRAGLGRAAPLPLATRLWPRSVMPGRRWWRRASERARDRVRVLLGG